MSGYGVGLLSKRVSPWICWTTHTSVIGANDSKTSTEYDIIFKAICRASLFRILITLSSVSGFSLGSCGSLWHIQHCAYLMLFSVSMFCTLWSLLLNVPRQHPPVALLEPSVWCRRMAQAAACQVQFIACVCLCFMYANHICDAMKVNMFASQSNECQCWHDLVKFTCVNSI